MAVQAEAGACTGGGMYLTRDGCRLWADHRGGGPRDLVFLHDIMMSSCAWAAQQTFAFRSEYKMHTLDFRGFGRSGRPGSACGIGTLVEDLRFVLGELGVRDPILVGAGMGATVAMAYAAASPTAVSRLVLVAATPCLVKRPDFGWGLAEAEAASVIAGLRRDFPRAVGEYTGWVFPEVPDRQVAGIMRVVAREADPVVVAACLSDLATLDLRPALPRIRVPVSVIGAFSDRFAPVWAGAWLANALDAERFLVVPAIGHAPYLSVAQYFNDALSSILAGFAAGRSPAPERELVARYSAEAANRCVQSKR